MGSPLVGRHNELRLARSALSKHGVAILSGPSGVGKTAICDVLAKEWVDEGRGVYEIRGTQGLKNVPFGAVTLALRVDTGNDDTETLARVVTALSAGDTGSLVVVDDAHLLDRQSAAIVSGLAQASEVAMILAVTSGESVSVDITSVWARWADSRIEVSPLDRDEVGELLEMVLGSEVSQEQVDEIASLSLGYPLYVTAIAAEVQTGRTDVSSLLARGAGNERLVALMERRLARLDREQRRMFDCLALAESTSASLLIAGRDPEVLEGLKQAGVAIQTGDRVRVAHPLIGSVARRTLTHEGRRSSAQSLLDGLDAVAEPGDVATIVRLAISVGVRPSVAYLRTAGELAMSWGDYEGVARITAVEPDDPGLAVVRARAARFLGETPSTEVPSGLDEAAITEYLSGTAQGIAYAERRFTDAIDFLREGMMSLTDERNRDRLALELMVLSGLVGDIDALLGAARAVSPSIDVNTRALALCTTQLAEALTLSTSDSEQTYEEGRSVVAGGGVAPPLPEQLEMTRTMVDLAEGKFHEARVRADSFEHKSLVGSWRLIESVMADACLPLDAAARIAQEAVDALQIFDPLANLAQARIVSALRGAQLGMPAPPSDPDAEHEMGVTEIDRIMSQRVEAWAAWSSGDTEAGSRLVRVGRDAISMGHRFWGLCALIDAVRLGLGAEVVTDIEQVVMTRGAGLARMAGRLARAETADDLWACARTWWEAGAPVYALETALRATSGDDAVGSLGVHLMAAREVAPVVGRISAAPSRISDRQLEIAAGVVDGRTNEQIADGLFISRRTVENHLHRLYTSLGLEDGRAQLEDRYGWISSSTDKASTEPVDSIQIVAE